MSVCLVFSNVEYIGVASDESYFEGFSYCMSFHFAMKICFSQRFIELTSLKSGSV